MKHFAYESLMPSVDLNFSCSSATLNGMVKNTTVTKSVENVI